MNSNHLRMTPQITIAMKIKIFAVCGHSCTRLQAYRDGRDSWRKENLLCWTLKSVFKAEKLQKNYYQASRLIDTPFSFSNRKVLKRNQPQMEPNLNLERSHNKPKVPWIFLAWPSYIPLSAKRLSNYSIYYLFFYWEIDSTTMFF